MNIFKIQYPVLKLDKNKIYNTIKHFSNTIISKYDLCNDDDDDTKMIRQELDNIPITNENINIDIEFGTKNIKASLNKSYSILKVKDNLLEDDKMQEIFSDFINIIENNLNVETINNIGMQFTSTLKIKSEKEDVNKIKEYFCPKFLSEQKEEIKKIDTVYTYEDEYYTKKIGFFSNNKNLVIILVQYICSYDNYLNRKINVKVLKEKFHNIFTDIKKKID